MSGHRRDFAERLLGLATLGLPPRRRGWGQAMRAELSAIESTAERRDFALSAARAALRQGVALQLIPALAASLAVAAIVLIASRWQLASGGPGVLGATVFLPALPLGVAAFVAGRRAHSFRFGLRTGALAVLGAFSALFVMLAVEGQVWMQRVGVFMLDGDPPRVPVGAGEIALDLITTGMWVGHLLIWLPWPVIGAALGAAIRRHPVAA